MRLKQRDPNLNHNWPHYFVESNEIDDDFRSGSFSSIQFLFRLSLFELLSACFQQNYHLGCLGSYLVA